MNVGPKANSLEKLVKSSKTEDTGEFLRQIRHVPDEGAKWSNVHSILHHQKPLLHCLDGCRG